MLYLRAPDGLIFDTTIAAPLQPAPFADLEPMPEVAAPPRTSARQELSNPPASPPVEPLVLPHPKLEQTLRHYNRVNAVAYSPDARLLATASSNAAYVWDSGVNVVLLEHNGGLSIVWGVAFSPDGRRLATVSNDTTARIWDFASGHELAKVTHDGPVNGVAFSPDGNELVTVSDDKTARIWVLSDDD